MGAARDARAARHRVRSRRRVDVLVERAGAREVQEGRARMGIDVRPLTGVSFDEIFECFSLGFSDYVVPFQPSREALLEMLTRRGWSQELSAGAFDDSRLVGFTLNCIDGDRAYDSGTTVIPSHRRRGIG